MATSKHQITAIINIHNESELLSKCLASIQNFADEIIVVDMESTDNGTDIARSFGAIVYHHKHQKVVETSRNFALKKATGKWIILLDPDEYLGKTLKSELSRITARADVDFVRIPRKNYIFGKWIRHARCWPDYLIRFFRKNSLNWQNAIHSQPVTKGNGLTLLDSEKLAIRHRNYKNSTDFIIRAIRYSTVQAEELHQSGYKPKTSDFLLKPIQEFNSRYFANDGYKDGLHGLVFCLLQSYATLLIYVRLWELQGSPDKNISRDSFVSASQETVYEYSYWFTKFFLEEYSSNLFKNLIVRWRHLLNRATKNF